MKETLLPVKSWQRQERMGLKYLGLTGTDAVLLANSETPKTRLNSFELILLHEHPCQDWMSTVDLYHTFPDGRHEQNG